MKCIRESYTKDKNDGELRRITRIDESQNEYNCVICESVIKKKSPYFSFTKQIDRKRRWYRTYKVCISCGEKAYKHSYVTKRV